MSLLAVFVHRIDPILLTAGGVHLWWYGLSYALGFLSIHRWTQRRRDLLNLRPAEVYDLTLLVAVGVLLGGRSIEVVFYEWSFYGRYPWLIPAYWLGGMATHGLLIGGVAGVLAFCRLRRRPFLEVVDVLSVPAALTLGLGRIGNFVDGQIVGATTNAPWAVVFPERVSGGGARCWRAFSRFA